MCIYIYVYIHVYVGICVNTHLLALSLSHIGSLGAFKTARLIGRRAPAGLSRILGTLPVSRDVCSRWAEP